MTACTLVIDARERNITRHDMELTGITRVIKQITVGDYAVISPAGQVLVTIERKSLEDFAASLKDGRHNNRAKLIDLRTTTGCRIIYIIEGPEFPEPHKLIGGIAYSNIESSIFHMMIRDCISVIRTADTLSTARTLARFVKSMDTLYTKYGAMPMEQQSTSPAPTVQTTNVIESLARKHAKSDHDVVREMWSCFQGITTESADEYMKHWSIADIVNRKVPRQSISALKMANGRTINKRVVDSLTSIGRPIEVRLITVVPGISRSSAVVLADATPLSQLITYDQATLADQCINKTNGRKLGQKIAKDMIRYFNYKWTQPSPTAVSILSSDSAKRDTQAQPVINDTVRPIEQTVIIQDQILDSTALTCQLDTTMAPEVNEQASKINGLVPKVDEQAHNESYDDLDIDVDALLELL